MQVVFFLATITIVAVAGETLDAASKTLRTTVGEDSKMAAGLVETHRAARALSAKSTNTANVHVEKGWAVKSTHLSSTCNGARK